jgi:hypothetical protein
MDDHEMITDDELFTDDELTACALAADPTEMLADDAVPFDTGAPAGLLPDWYMPVPQVSGPSRRRAGVVGIFVASLLALNAVGLCVTYGTVVIAW